MQNTNNKYAPMTEQDFSILVEEIQNVYGDYRLNNSYVMDSLRSIATDPLEVYSRSNTSNAELTHEFLLDTFYHKGLGAVATTNAFRAIGRENELPAHIL